MAKPSKSFVSQPGEKGKRKDLWEESQQHFQGESARLSFGE